MPQSVFHPAANRRVTGPRCKMKTQPIAPGLCAVSSSASYTEERAEDSRVETFDCPFQDISCSVIGFANLVARAEQDVEEDAAVF